MVAPTNRGFVTFPEKAAKPGFPRGKQAPVDPDSLDLGPLGAGRGQYIPNLDYQDTHDVVPGAPNAYDFLGQDMGGRMLQTGAPGINPFAAIQQVGDVVEFPWDQVRRNNQLMRDLGARHGYPRPLSWVQPGEPSGQIIRINPFVKLPGR